MKRLLCLALIISLFAGCRQNSESRLQPLARAGNATLNVSDLPSALTEGLSSEDSVHVVQNFINEWAKKTLLYQKAEENLSSSLREGINKQVEETRKNLVIYRYQQQMMLERMDTLISESETEAYYAANQLSFMLVSNIVKALFIKLPLETPDIARIKQLARSNDQVSLQQLESLCYQFAEKFDDFNEDWITLDRLSVELPQEIQDEDAFLRRYSFYETYDSTDLYLISFRDFRLRNSTAPYEYVKDDIKRMIWNTRRIEFIQSLQDGIYNDALKENRFSILK
jgi:hypothetical protein